MRQCSDCQIQLEPIRVLDATHPGVSGDGSKHTDLRYAPIDARAAWYSGTVREASPITGMICPSCRRISLFG